MNTLKFWFTNLPLGRQLQLVVTGLLLAVCVLLVVSLPWLWQDAQRNSRQHLEMALRPLLMSALSGPMIERDYASVQEIASNLLHSEWLAGIEVRSVEGVLVTAMPAALPSSEDVMTVRLASSGLALGEVRVQLRGDPYAELLRRPGLELIALMGAVMVVAVALVWRWSLGLTRRLERLSVAVHEVAQGQYGKQVARTSRDEIGQLADDINAMSRAVHKAVSDIRQRESELAAILHSIGDGLIATDTAMRVTYMNPVAEVLTGWTDTEARGRSVAEIMQLVHALTGEPAEIPVGRVLETGHVVGLANHTVLIARDGRRLHIADSAAPVRASSGELAGVVMVFRDVSESYRLRADLDAQRQRLALALKGADLGLWDLDLTSKALVVDSRWATMLGWLPQQVPRDLQGLQSLVHADDESKWLRALDEHLRGQSTHFEVEVRLRMANGSYRWILSRAAVTMRSADGQPLRLTGTHLDIHERRTAQEEINRLAFYDALTGLPNRRLLLERLQHELSQVRRSGQWGALMFVDLDRFKPVNDAWGHAAGDLVLREAARRLRAGIRETDIVARLAGDEFVVVLCDLMGEQAQVVADVQRVAEALRSALLQPYDLGQGRGWFHSSACIGVAVFGGSLAEAVDDAAQVLQHADTAMYAAKAAGRNAVRFYEPAMQSLVEDRIDLERALRQAIAEGQVQLYLQPQYSTDGRLVGAEGLLRWHHTQRGWVPPSVFIPLAEDVGLIDPLGDWVLKTAAHLIAFLERQGMDVRLSVNVSARQLRQTGFAQRVREHLQRAGASPARLTLEVTESMLLDDLGKAVALLTELRSIGVRLSLDDFGTGYSSLSYLKQLPLNEIKIDRSFVAGLPHDDSDVVLTSTILAIGQKMGLEVVAEGIETQAQQRWLQEHGCVVLQGYYLGRPEPLQAFCQRLGLAFDRLEGALH